MAPRPECARACCRPACHGVLGCVDRVCVETAAASRSRRMLRLRPSLRCADGAGIGETGLLRTPARRSTAAAPRWRQRRRLVGLRRHALRRPVRGPGAGSGRARHRNGLWRARPAGGLRRAQLARGRRSAPVTAGASSGMGRSRELSFTEHEVGLPKGRHSGVLDRQPVPPWPSSSSRRRLLGAGQ